MKTDYICTTLGPFFILSYTVDVSQIQTGCHIGNFCVHMSTNDVISGQSDVTKQVAGLYLWRVSMCVSTFSCMWPLFNKGNTQKEEKYSREKTGSGSTLPVLTFLWILRKNDGKDEPDKIIFSPVFFKLIFSSRSMTSGFFVQQLLFLNALFSFFLPLTEIKPPTSFFSLPRWILWSVL